MELAAVLLAMIIAAFPDRDVHGVGDAAYHGKPLLVPRDDVDDPAAGQRLPVRHRATADARQPK